VKSNFIVVSMLITISLCGCARANVTQNREAYILSQPHGWIEITVKDVNVPSVLPPKDLPPENITSWKSQPPDCDFIVKLNNERFLYESIFPYGDGPSYRVDTGFRFPAPVGDFRIEIIYSGCNVETEKSAPISFLTIITIEENKVVPALFDGFSFILNEIEENDVITLEDIYQKLNE